MEVEFGDAETLIYDVPSSWQAPETVKLKNRRVQTEWVETYDACENAIERADAETQTETATSTADAELSLAQVNEEHLFKFLAQVLPIMESELKSSATSTAFKGFSVGRGEEDDITLITRLHHEPLVNTGLHCTGVDWSCSGGVVAAAYGRYDHVDWCEHKGYLCAWRVNRRSLRTDRADFVFETGSCVMCVAFHPHEPEVVAIGTFTGEVIVINTASEDASVLGKSTLDDVSHREPIARLAWWEGERGRLRLVSVANDGKVLVWDLSNALAWPLGGYKLFPRHMTSAKTSGGTAVSFSPADPASFFAGTESGGVYKCSFTADPSFDPNDVAPRHQPDVAFRSPIAFTYASHAGPVYSVAASPFHRNVVTSASSDGVLHVTHALTKDPVLSLEPSSGFLLDTLWSPTRPCVLFLADSEGYVHVYDLQASKGSAVLSVEVGASGSAVHGLAICPSNPSRLATCDAVGDIALWRLSHHLSAQQAGEEDVLGELAGGVGSD